jgi:hypothetical protein
MREERMQNTNEGDTVCAGGCAYLGGIAADLRVLVMAQCPGCQGTGPCIIRQAIRTLAESSPADACATGAAATRPVGAIQ